MCVYLSNPYLQHGKIKSHHSGEKKKKPKTIQVCCCLLGPDQNSILWPTPLFNGEKEFKFKSPFLQMAIFLICSVYELKSITRHNKELVDSAKTCLDLHVWICEGFKQISFHANWTLKAIFSIHQITTHLAIQ